MSVGRHPHESEGFDDAGLEELRELSAHPKARAVGEAGLDYKRDYAPRDDQRRSFIAQIELAKSLGRPLVVHTREAADDTVALLDEHGDGVEVIIHCFSLVRPRAGLRRAPLVLLVRGQRHLPEGDRPAAGRGEVPDELLLAETDAPFLSPQERRSKPNEPAYVTATARYLAKLRDTSVRRWRASWCATPRACSAGERGPRKPRPHVAARHPPQPRAGPELPRRRQRARGDRAHGRARSGRRRARDRRRPRGAERLSRSRACATCTWSRPTRSSSRCCARRSPTAARHALHGRRDEAAPRRSRPAAEQGRVEPALRRRDVRACCARSRSCPR